jgi:hypothetical protein
LANIFWAGEKSPQDETLVALRKKAVEVWDGAFHARFRNGYLELVIEHPSDEHSGLWEKFEEPKFMGHEFHILKVPKGFLKGIDKKST